MKLLIIIISLMLVGCGEGFLDQREFKSVGPEFKEYYALYKEKCGKNASHIGIGLKNNVGGKAAKCRVYQPTDTRDIAVSRDTWERYTHEQRMWLVFHELGHCSLGIKAHDERTENNGDPTSMMHSKVPTNAKALLDGSNNIDYIADLCGE